MMLSQKTRCIVFSVIILCLTGYPVLATVIDEDDFYKETIHLVDRTVNLAP